MQHPGRDEAWSHLGQEIADAPDCAWKQRDWAVLSLRSGRLAEARQRLLALVGQHPESPALRFGLGLNLLYDRSTADAAGQSRARFEEALAQLDGNTGPAETAEGAICRGFCLLALSALAADPAEAERLIEESRACFAEGGSPAGQGLALKQLAGLKELQGNAARALSFAEAALARFAVEDCLGGSPLALHLVANALSRLGETRRAVDCYRRSLEGAEAQGDDDCRLRNMVSLGQLARVDDAEEALRWFDRALPVARALGQDPMLLWVLQVRGRFCGTELNRYRTALDNYEEALAIARRNGYQATAARCLDSLGQIRSRLGSFDEALLDFQQAADLVDAEGITDPRLESSINRGMGYLLWKNGATEQALVRLERAAGLAESAGDTAGLANARHLRGAALSASGRPAEARPLLQQALAAYGLLKDSYGQAGVRYSLGRAAEASGDGTAAGEQYREAARLGETGDYPVLAWSSNYRLGRLALAAGDLERSRQHLEAALVAIGRSRSQQAEDALKWAYMEDKHQVFCAWADVLERTEGAGEAFAAAEQAHAIALLDLLREGEPAALPRITVDEARSVVPEHGALLEYLLGEDVSFLFVIDDAGTAAHRLPPRAELEEAAADYLERLRIPVERVRQAPSAELTAAGRRLHQLLLGPLEQRLSGTAAPLVIVADGLLHHLPFEALITPGDGPPQYLAGRHEIAYAPSAAVLARLATARAAEPDEDRLDLLAIGDPDFSGHTHPLAPPPHSGREVRRIARRLARARAFTGPEAVKDLLADPQLAGARVIHLATHALVDETSAQGSAIVFSIGTGEESDGLLGPAEIMGLDLDSELVVLSACSTGLGRPVRGEGVVGLSRAFLSAGSRSVVQTLWPVEDRFTAGLMERFFDGLGRSRHTAGALADARLESLLDGAHPHFWAPFVLLGDGGSTIPLEPKTVPDRLLALLLIAAGVVVLAAGIFLLRRKR